MAENLTAAEVRAKAREILGQTTPGGGQSLA